MSRIQFDKFELNIEATNLEKTIRSPLQILQFMAEQKKNVIDLSIDPSTPE